MDKQVQLEEDFGVLKLDLSASLTEHDSTMNYEGSVLESFSLSLFQSSQIISIVQTRFIFKVLLPCTYNCISSFTCRPIEKGEEIFVHYGYHPWDVWKKNRKNSRRTSLNSSSPPRNRRVQCGTWISTAKQ